MTEKSELIRAAEMDIKFNAQLFNRIANVCFDKCITKKCKDSELNIGESSCVDRCSSKYFQAFGLVAQMMQGQQGQQSK